MEDLIQFTLRFVTGIFFVLYRFRWVWDPSKEADQWFCKIRACVLENRLRTCGYCEALAPAVAIGEILAGLGLISGLLTLPSALGLILIMVFGMWCLMPEELPKMKPVDRLDWLRCFLMWPEPLYAIMCLLIVIGGPGRWSLDYLLWGWL